MTRLEVFSRYTFSYVGDDRRCVPKEDLPTKEDADLEGNVKWLSRGMGFYENKSWCSSDAVNPSTDGWCHTDRWWIERNPLNAKKFGLNPIE